MYPAPSPGIIDAMTRDDAAAFARDWLKAWNAHDPDALRSYWEAGLQRIPDLHFEVLGFYMGIDTLVINYRNQPAP